MGTRTSMDGELVIAVARTMFERIVAMEPEQAPARRVFNQQAQSYLADPEAALAGADHGSAPLGFGLTGVEVLLVPVLMQAAADVVGYLTGEAVLRGVAASGPVVRRLFAFGAFGAHGADGADGAFGARGADGADGADEADDAVLTVRQWAEVRRIVEDVLIRHANMAPGRAGRLAVAVVGEGVLRGPSE